MDNPIIVLLENSGLIVDGKAREDRLRKIKTKDIAKLAEQMSEVTSYEKITVEPAAFKHSASTTLGAGDFPCHSLGCRLQKAKELSQFAALYSDKVYIRNFLYERLISIEQASMPDEEIFHDFSVDISILAMLLPLIESGKIDLVTYEGICPHCLTMRSLQLSSPKELDAAFSKLVKRYYKEVSYSLVYNEDDDTFDIASRGPEALIPHGGPIYSGISKEALANIPSIEAKAKTLGEIQLTSAQSRKLKLGERFPDALIYSASFELGGSHFLKTSYVSDNELEIDFIRNLTTDPIARRRSSIMQKHLTCILPFIQNVDIAALLKLREEESESFNLFRTALIKAIEDYKTQGERFTERDAQAIYADVIHAKLSMLDSKIKNASRRFAKENRSKLISWSAAISVGICSGIIAANVVDIVAAIGLIKGAELLDEIITKSNKEDSIKDDELYFLWRVRNIAEKRNIYKLPSHKSSSFFI